MNEASQRKYNQGTKAGNPIINIMLNEISICSGSFDLSSPFRGTGGLPLQRRRSANYLRKFCSDRCLSCTVIRNF